ncbi:UNVERIFIED_CONTAM: hypothetical protein FKN15_052914, partial [Acipenser sinensis]
CRTCIDLHCFTPGKSKCSIIFGRLVKGSVCPAQGDEDAFYVADLGDIVKKHLRWMTVLPRVQPFYAVKCNAMEAVVQTLARLGSGFDCASQTSHIKKAASLGVHTMTFDNEEELIKVSRAHPNAKMVLRIATADSGSMFPISIKFGASLEECGHLLKVARELGVEVIGVSESIANARGVFDLGADLGHEMTLLDIGGGFPGSDDFIVTFEEIAKVIKQSLEVHFPAESGVNIIAEPGRYYVASAFTLAVNIIGKKCLPWNKDTFRGEECAKSVKYYINDGGFGSFADIFHCHFTQKAVPYKQSVGQPLYSSSVWGPTCTADDLISNQTQLPELQVGDWLIFENMGAYTVSLGTHFNGFSIPRVHFCISSKICKAFCSRIDGDLPIAGDPYTGEDYCSRPDAQQTGTGFPLCEYYSPHSASNNAVAFILIKCRTCMVLHCFTPGKSKCSIIFGRLVKGSVCPSQGDEDAFYVADLGDIVKKHLRWTTALPRVQPFYAVKCNAMEAVVQTLARLGSGFDCASQVEFELVRGMGVLPERIIYANPCKQTSHIKKAASLGVHTMTFDNEEELIKVSRAHPNAKMVLRIATADSGSMFPISIKFGASLEECGHLLKVARELGEECAKSVKYYINDGGFGSFADIFHCHFTQKAVPYKQSVGQPLYSSSVWGPTCTADDLLFSQTQLPELQVGDWLVFENMGAYTVSLGTHFNGFSIPRVHFCISSKIW